MNNAAAATTKNIQIVSFTNTFRGRVQARVTFTMSRHSDQVKVTNSYGEETLVSREEASAHMASLEARADWKRA